jgi:hypothetical protein
MITLEFRVDEQEFLTDLASDPADADAGVLEETYFVSPVRFSIDGRELLAVSAEGDPWRDLPLLGMAWGIRQMLTLPPDKDFRLHLAGGGHLSFRRSDESIRVINSLTGTEACASTNELKHSATEFLRRVREIFEASAPQLKSHRGWSTWFG